MLIKCPECGLSLSDKAFMCPHCGMPMKNEAKNISRTKKRRRLPNGFGQICEIKGQNLRNPFRAQVTVGRTPEGRPIAAMLKPKAYFPTYNDAYAALVEYNRHPYDLDPKITVEELYEKWLPKYLETLSSDSARRSVKLVWKYCSEVYRLPVSELRPRHIRGCIEKGTANIYGVEKPASPITQKRIKCLFNSLLDYAVEYDIIDKNCSRELRSLSGKQQKISVKNPHFIFTDEEISALWENANRQDLMVDAVLIQCYGGWRPQELCSIKLDDVDLDNRTIIGGIKTEAGTNRIVPIHPKIYDLVSYRYEKAKSAGSKYLFGIASGKTNSYSQLRYDSYRLEFHKIVSTLNLNPNHRPHDCRKHFVTTAKKYGVDDFVIKRVVGHAIKDITESYYTDRSSAWLLDEMSKIEQ